MVDPMLALWGEGEKEGRTHHGATNQMPCGKRPFGERESVRLGFIMAGRCLGSSPKCAVKTVLLYWSMFV
jgi:hypothetical protein